MARPSFDLHGESAELIFAFGHAGGSHGIGDEDGAFADLWPSTTSGRFQERCGCRRR